MESTGAAYLIFRLGDEDYSLPVSVVNSVIRYEESTPVPRSPSSVMGVINMRGRVIPVVDLRLRFTGERFIPGAMSRIVVAEGTRGPVGIACDVASEVTLLTETDIRPVPEGVLGVEAARAFIGVVERDGSLVIVLDLDEAVGRTDMAGVSALSYEEGVPGE
jgi:purine-binding chemotaxis protein CheW